MQTSLTSKLCILIPTLNRPVLLERAVSCVLKQSFKDWCLVIINDGGNETEVEDLIYFLKNKYNCNNEIVIIHNAHSLGKAAACNKGLQLVKSEMVIVLNDDDSWAHEFLVTAVSQLEYNHSVNPNIQAVIPLANTMYEEYVEDHVFIKWCDVPDGRQLNPHNNYIHLQSLASTNLFSSSQFLFYKKAADYIGPYDTDLVIFSDWEFHIRFACAFSIYIITQPFVNIHKRFESTDRSYINLIQQKDNQVEFYNELLTEKFLKIKPQPAGNEHFNMSVVQIQTIVNLRLAGRLSGGHAQHAHAAHITNHHVDIRIAELSNRIAYLEHQSRRSEEWFRYIDYRLTPAIIRKGSKAVKLVKYGLKMKHKTQKLKKLFVSLSRDGVRKTLSKIKNKLNER
jgi:glycosyltransferase involved in cell wall biosynthesis